MGTPIQGRKRGPHPVKRLTSVAVRNLGPGRHADGNGLYLEVDPSGARRWMLRTLVHGRRREIGLGSTSLVGLAEAREKAAALRKVARNGGDPVAERDKHKRRSPTFEEAARHVYRTRILPATKKPEAMAQWLGRLEVHAFPAIGSKHLHTIAPADVLRVLEPIWLTRAETARRVRQRAKVVHRAALPWRDLPALWPRLEAADGMGSLALCFSILTAARSSEVRFATWAEIDLEGAVWAIPADRMKMERPHRVPLAPAALAILRELHPLEAGPDSLVFPSTNASKPLSGMTLSAVLRRLDVAVTVHGFRSTFRDWAEEGASYTHAVKEAALAHAVENKVEAAYRRGDLLDQRRPMMIAWARYATKGGAKLVKLAGGA